MGKSKNDEFTLRDNRVAQYAKALAHPARVAILRKLIESDTCICNDIVAELPLSQSTVSQHLNELKEAGLIKGNTSGASTCYCINADEWKNASEIFSSFLKMFNPRKQKCC